MLSLSMFSLFRLCFFFVNVSIGCYFIVCMHIYIYMQIDRYIEDINIVIDIDIDTDIYIYVCIYTRYRIQDQSS